MLTKRSILALASLATFKQVTAFVASPQLRSTGPDETIPSAFDGQYITNPPPGPGNQAVEWWWFQALAPEVNGIIPSVEVNFYKGFAFSRGPSDPSYRFDVNGVFPNGTSFFISTPVANEPTIHTAGEAISGNWDGLGAFSMSGDRKHLAITFNNSQHGLTGTISFTNLGTPAHGPCSDSTKVAPYFSQLSSGKKLNAQEALLYEQTGWAISVPRAATVVDLTISGSRLFLNNAIGYHDHNWAPVGLDKFAYTWLTGQGSCGPFDLTYLEVQALGSKRSGDILKGFLAHDGKYLQNECSLYGDKKVDTLSVELTGQTTDSVTGQQVPTGMTLDYTLANGTHYVFTLHNSPQSFDQIPYHRWRLGGSGGKVGGPQYSCLLIGDWLNPGLAKYSAGKSIFEEQSSASSS